MSFYDSLRHGILIPQWAGGLCGGHGCPLFFFEYVSPYYFGSIFHVLGFSFITSIKLVLATLYVLSGVTMYAFLRTHFRNNAAFIGSLLYIFAPIRFIEMHFRVSVGTDVAFVFIPLAFLFVQKSLKGNLLYVFSGAVNLWLLILSHSSIAFITVITSVLYGVLISKNPRQIIYPFLSMILGIGLSSYYILPAVVLVKHTWMIFDQRVTEFHSLIDHIVSPARFGLLFQGNNGEFRLIVGYAHIIATGGAIYYLVKKKFDFKDRKLVLMFLFLTVASFLMLSSATKSIWNSVFFLRTFILPWRLLVPIAFFTAFLGGFVTENMTNKRLVFIFALFVVFSTILNWGNRKMVFFNEKFTFAAQNMLYTEYVHDPKSSKSVGLYKLAHDKVINDPYYVYKIHTPPISILEGDGKAQTLEFNPTDHKYLVDLRRASLVSENTYYFPGWNLYVDGNPKSIKHDFSEKSGLIIFKLPKGLHVVDVKFQDPPIVSFGRKISFLSLIVLLFIMFNYLTKLVSKASGKYRLRFPRFYS